MFEKFTERSRKVLSLARQRSQSDERSSIDSEHILVGLLIDDGGVAATVLKNLGVTMERLTKALKELFVPAPTVKLLGQIPFSPHAKRVIELSYEAATALGCDSVGTEHLLLAIVKEQKGLASQALLNMGIKPEAVQNMIFELLGVNEKVKTSYVTDSHIQVADPQDVKRGVLEALDKFSVNPAVICCKCRRMGAEPTTISKTEAHGWVVTQWEPRFPEGWLSIDKQEVPFGSKTYKVLCVSCRKAMDL